MSGSADIWDEGALATIAEIAGDEAAAKLANTVGGTQIWIPSKATQGTQLVELVGLKAARAIVERFGAGALLIPLGPATSHARQRRAIHALLKKGHSHQAVARMLKCHVRTVERVANSAPPRPSKQLDLLAQPR